MKFFNCMIGHYIRYLSIFIFFSPPFLFNYTQGLHAQEKENQSDELSATATTNASHNNTKAPNTNIRYVNKNPQRPITFGIEVEYDVEKYPKILDFYKPMRDNPPKKEDIYQPTDEEWSKLSFHQKYELFKKHHFKEKLIDGKLFSRWKGDDVIRYEKLKHFTSSNPDEVELWKSMHPNLGVEPRGNVEVNGLVFKDLTSIQKFMHLLKKTVGEGDAQVHVVFPQQNLDHIFGYTLYEHDQSFLRRLDQEYYEYLKNPHYLPANQANSDWDGLLSNTRKNQIKTIEELIKQGNFPKGEISRVYRAGIPTINKVAYPEELLGFEFRQEDNPSENMRTYVGSFDRLLAGMERLSHIMEKEGNLQRFQAFDDLSLPFDLNDYEVEKTHGHVEEDALKKNIQFVLDRLRQIKEATKDNSENPGNPENPQSKKLRKNLRKLIKTLDGRDGSDQLWSTLANNLRNKFSQRSTMHAFLHPLRDWDHHPVIENLKEEKKHELIKKIHQATYDYVQELVRISKESLPSTMARKARIALSKWSHEANIHSAFKQFERDHELSGDSTFEVSHNPTIINEQELNYYPKNHQIVAEARKNNVMNILKLVAEGVDVNSVDLKHYTPLSIASFYNHQDLVKILMQHKLDPTIKNYLGGMALHQAASQNHTDLVIELLKSPAVREKINSINQYKKSALEFAIKNGNLKMVIELIKHGAHTKPVAGTKKSAKELAISYHQADILAYLNALDGYNSELIKKIAEKDEEAVERIIKLGANINHELKNITPLIQLLKSAPQQQQLSSADEGQEEKQKELKILDLLIHHGVHLNAIDLEGKSPLIHAIEAGKSHLGKKLIENSSLHLKHQDHSGKSALDYAVKMNNEMITRQLLSKSKNKLVHSKLTSLLKEAKNAGATKIYHLLKIIEQRNEELLTLAEQDDELAVLDEIKVLVEKGTSLVHKNKQGENILMVAARKGHVQLTEYLLQHNIKMNAHDYLHQDTALSLALHYGHKDIVKLLIADNRTNFYDLNEYNESLPLIVKEMMDEDLNNLAKSHKDLKFIFNDCSPSQD